jgi:glycosyltransferase involved in cell wall biosynthesis
MKVVNAMFSKVNGGLEQVFLNYMPALAQQGNQVIPIIHPKAEIIDACPQEHLRTVHNFNQHDFFAIYKLRKLIQQEQPHCIITHSYRAAYLFKKTKTRVPKIAVCHVQGHYNFGSDAIIAITEPMRQDIIKAGIPAHKVFTVPNMIPFPQHLEYQEPKPRDVAVIGVCARFVSMKGIDVFLASLAELKKRQVPFKAEIAGDGPERELYLKLIAEYKLASQVKLLGWVHHREEFYRNLDIFCLPSRKEAFGLVILESMLHSLPLVITDLPGPREIIAQSDSALVVPSEDPISMANSLERLIKDKELAKQCAINAFKRVQHYSIASVGPLLHEVLEKVCRAYAY